MLKKLLVGLVLLVVVLVAVVVVTIKIMLTPERIRTTLIPLVEKQINRKLEYKDISIGLFSGISISDLTLWDKDGTEEFVSVETMAFRYRFRPLLSRRIEISEIVLDRPRISIVRFTDGSFNFSDLLEADAASEAGEKTAKEEKPAPDKTETAGMTLLVEEIRITEGELHYQDRFVNPKTPLKYVLNHFNLKTRNFTLASSFPFEISALVNGADFSLSGNYNVKSGEGDVALGLASLDLMPFKPYFADNIPGKLSSAKISTKLGATLGKEKMTSKGELGLDHINLILDDLPEAPFENLSLGFDYDIGLDTLKNFLDIASVHFSLNEIMASGKGSLDLAPEVPVLNFSLLLNELDLSELMQKAPPGLVKDYKGYGLQGKVSGEVLLAGAVDKGAGLLKSAALDLKDVNARVNATRTGVNGKLGYANNKLKTDGIDFHYADQHGKLTLDMDYLAGKKPLIRGNFAVTTDKIDLNRLVPESGETASSQTAPAQKPQKQSAPAKEIGPFDLPLDIKGLFSVKEMLYKKLPVTDSKVQISLKNNLFTLEKLTGRTAGGTLNADAKVNLAVKGLSYEGKVNLGETDVARVMAGLFPENKLYVEGKALADARFSGRGTLPATMLPALQLSGKASILEGLVKETEIQNAIALFLGISELKIVSFESLVSNFSMKNKVLTQDSFLDSSRLQVKSAGTISTDGPLNLNFDSRFSPELMAKIKGPQAELTKYLADEKGWGGFILTVKGTLDNPKIGLDTSAIKKQATETAKEKLSEKLTEKLSDKFPTSPGSKGDTQKDDTRDALKQLLKLPGKK